MIALGLESIVWPPHPYMDGWWGETAGWLPTNGVDLHKILGDNQNIGHVPELPPFPKVYAYTANHCLWLLNHRAELWTDGGLVRNDNRSWQQTKWMSVWREESLPARGTKTPCIIEQSMTERTPLSRRQKTWSRLHRSQRSAVVDVSDCHSNPGSKRAKTEIRDFYFACSTWQTLLWRVHWPDVVGEQAREMAGHLPSYAERDSENETANTSNS